MKVKHLGIISPSCKAWHLNLILYSSESLTLFTCRFLIKCKLIFEIETVNLTVFPLAAYKWIKFWQRHKTQKLNNIFSSMYKRFCGFEQCIRCLLFPTSIYNSTCQNSHKMNVFIWFYSEKVLREQKYVNRRHVRTLCSLVRNVWAGATRILLCQDI